MSESGIERVKNVWETKNKITNPNIQDDILEIVDQIASLFSAGSFFYFVFDYENMETKRVSENITEIFGIEPESYTLDYILTNLHPEDIEKFHEKETVGFDFLLNKITTEDIPNYKVVYLLRIKDSNGTYKTILHQSRAINISKDSKIQQILCVQTDLTYLNIPINHTISFIGNKRPSYYVSDTTLPYKFVEPKINEKYTKKEYAILNKIAEGQSVNKIAEELNLSPHTISTHKKNILRKSECNNTAELITRCIREGII